MPSAVAEADNLEGNRHLYNIQSDHRPDMRLFMNDLQSLIPVSTCRPVSSPQQATELLVPQVRQGLPQLPTLQPHYLTEVCLK